MRAGGLVCQGGAEGVDVVEAFPGEEVDGEGAVAVVGVVECLGDGLRLASDVAVGCGLAVDGLAQAQSLLYGVWAHVEYLRYFCRERGIGEADMRCAEGVDAQAHGACHADGVGHLHESAVGDAGGHDVFGDVPCGVGCGAVDLGGVFA